jgi:hypothetical protein
MALQFGTTRRTPAMQATYIQADLYQQSFCRLYDLGLESVSLDSAKESSVE